jgi:hypothetical protein
MLYDITTLWLAVPVVTDNAVAVDWTSVIIAIVGASAAMFSAYMAKQAATASRNNSILLKTNSGKTIGEHIEQLQEDQLVLRDELSAIAQAKLKADALLAAASIEAIAKLTAAADIHIQETATRAADDLLGQAQKTASNLDTERNKN